MCMKLPAHTIKVHVEGEIFVLPDTEDVRRYVNIVARKFAEIRGPIEIPEDARWVEYLDI